MKKILIFIGSLFASLIVYPPIVWTGQVVHSPNLNLAVIESSIYSVSKLGIRVQSGLIESNDINFNSIKILDVHQEGNTAFVYCNFNNKQGEKYFGYISLIKQKNSTVWINRNNGLILEKFENESKNGEINEGGTSTYPEGRKYVEGFREGVRINGSKAYPGGTQDRNKWQDNEPLGNTQKLPGQEPQQSAKHIKVSSQDLIAGEGTPSRELHQSVVPAEQVDPQTSKVDKISIKDKVQTEAINENQLKAVEKIKSEAATPVGKLDRPKPKVILPQNLKTTKAMEYASMAVGANIRSDASLTSEVLRTVPPNYPVAVLEKRADWLLVNDFWGRKGWVYAALVTEPKTVIIKVFKGNLRSGPSLDDDIIVQLDYGTIMSVLERDGEWLKVSNLEELTGWLHFTVIWPSAAMDEWFNISAVKPN